MSEHDDVTDEAAELVVERRGHVLVARLNRPDARNSLNASCRHQSQYERNFRGKLRLCETEERDHFQDDRGSVPWKIFND